jgi:hypothetical protein
MIGRIRNINTLTLVASLALLASCGNDKSATRGPDAIVDLVKIVGSSLSGANKDAVSAAPDPVAMVNNALIQIPDQPLHFFLMENTGAFAITSIYGRNGSYVSWITPDRKTVTLKRGVLSATRGLGSDLMSVEDGGAARLIAGRQSGTVRKSYRYLTRADEINRLELTCTIERGAPAQVDSGEISAQTILMTENCAAGELQFANSYWVDAAGRTVQSVQWVSGAVGKIVFRKLRH